MTYKSGVADSRETLRRGVFRFQGIRFEVPSKEDIERWTEKHGPDHFLVTNPRGNIVFDYEPLSYTREGPYGNSQLSRVQATTNLLPTDRQSGIVNTAPLDQAREHGWAGIPNNQKITVSERVANDPGAANRPYERLVAKQGQVGFDWGFDEDTGELSSPEIGSIWLCEYGTDTFPAFDMETKRWRLDRAFFSEKPGQIYPVERLTEDEAQELIPEEVPVYSYGTESAVSGEANVSAILADADFGTTAKKQVAFCQAQIEEGNAAFGLTHVLEKAAEGNLGDLIDA